MLRETSGSQWFQHHSTALPGLATNADTLEDLLEKDKHLMSTECKKAGAGSSMRDLAYSPLLSLPDFDKHFP